MPEPTMEPTTSAVELKSPRDWTICGPEGALTVAGKVADLEAIGIVTWIGFTGFSCKCLVLSF
jgi:hypothetical protein